ncbi:MAG: hypothetical protein NZ518_02125 [Dehalococcoidia bacterium]|nr:hypothetical protein [Dehalococcoidia bacterium]
MSADRIDRNERDIERLKAEVLRLTRRSDDPNLALDRVVTFRDLVALGLVTESRALVVAREPPRGR